MKRTFRTRLLLTGIVLVTGCASMRLKGSVAGNTYTAPDRTYTVRIPNINANPSVTDLADHGATSVTFMVPYGELFRIDCLGINKHALARAAEHATDEQIVDSVLINMLNFTASTTQGLDQMSLVEKRTSTDLHAPISFAAYTLKINDPSMRGTYSRGYLVFRHADSVYVLHYQPAGRSTGADTIFQRMMAFRESIDFADRPAR